FPTITADGARITLYTSGSTGAPKPFPKRLTELEAETGELYRLWGSLIEGRRVYSTVNQQHIYGLLFTVLLPISMGVPFCEDIVRYPESLESLGDRNPALVCSPAFFKRLAETEIPPNLFPGGCVVFSSGGVLTEGVARETEKRIGVKPIEIYGSTETGGIAYRTAVIESSWKPFSRHEVSINEEGRVVVKSPYILDPAGFVSGDLGHFIEDGRFILDGRADSIVKIEEKRISLTEVENRILESPYAREACAIALTGKRQYLGAVVALSDEGKAFFAGKEKREINDFFRGHLAHYLENTVIPKKWRFVEALPRDSQDKLKRADITALFGKTPDVRTLSLSKTEKGLSIELSIASTSVYFDGHFPSFKLLPAVVQFDLVMEYAAEHLGLSPKITSIKRVKFRKPIQPETKLALTIDYDRDADRLTFNYADAESGKAYSEGTIQLEAQ
ncbi:MAG TPA: AMP-binding protein, partial [Treponemataceae bacterium]|nr:AMP-binding protein [Treponemataceae bacterium]